MDRGQDSGPRSVSRAHQKSLRPITERLKRRAGLDSRGCRLVYGFALCRLPRLEGISKATYRMDNGRVRRVLLHLLPQTQNVDVDGTVGDRPILSPHRIEQLFAAENHADPVHQELEQA